MATPTRQLTAPATILVLAPHTDDAELSCGGSLWRLRQQGSRIYVAVFSTCEESLPPGAPKNLLRDEFMEAMRRLQIPEENTSVLDYPVRRMPAYRQEILEQLVKLRRDIDPDMVLLPAPSDLHQDHRVLCDEGIRAFKDRTVWGYEQPWNNVNFASQALITLQREDLQAKWEALQAYRSQIELKRPYFCWSFIESMARVHGVRVRADYAEAFEVVRVKW